MEYIVSVKFTIERNRQILSMEPLKTSQQEALFVYLGIKT